MKKYLLIGSLVALFASNASASSPAAWAEYKLDVERACRILVGPPPKNARVTVEVEPNGTESYGAALVTIAGKQKLRHICIYNKASKKAELTGEF